MEQSGNILDGGNFKFHCLEYDCVMQLHYNTVLDAKAVLQDS